MSGMTGSPWPEALQPPSSQPRGGASPAPAEPPAEAPVAPAAPAATRPATPPPAADAAQPSASPPAGRPARDLPRTAPLPPERPDFGETKPGETKPGETKPDEPQADAGQQPRETPSIPPPGAPMAPETATNGLPAVAPLPPVRPQFPLDAGEEAPQPQPQVAPQQPQQPSVPSWWPFGRKKDETEAPLEEAPDGRRVMRRTVTDAEVNACVARLRKAGAVVERIAPIANGSCGVRNGVRLTALPGGIPLSKPGTMTCAMAEATAEWLRGVAQPAARQRLQANITAVLIGPTYACRTMNHQRGAKLSEHAYANAIDIAGFAFDQRGNFMVRPSHTTSGENLFQAFIRKNACRIFDTVIGPGGDRFHNDHLHLDLRNRGSGRQVCR